MFPGETRFSFTTSAKRPPSRISQQLRFSFASSTLPPSPINQPPPQPSDPGVQQHARLCSKSTYATHQRTVLRSNFKSICSGPTPRAARVGFLRLYRASVLSMWRRASGAQQPAYRRDHVLSSMWSNVLLLSVRHRPHQPRTPVS